MEQLERLEHLHTKTQFYFLVLKKTTKKMNKEKPTCPICNHILYKKYEGHVCKNWKCKLYHKLGKGWVYLGIKTKEEHIVNDLWGQNYRIMLRKEWVIIKDIIIRKYNYSCQFCDYNMSDDFDRNKRLEVHHIIPAHKQSALYFDEDNLILCCNTCHKKLHLTDKYKF